MLSEKVDVSNKWHVHLYSVIEIIWDIRTG